MRGTKNKLTIERVFKRITSPSPYKVKRYIDFLEAVSKEPKVIEKLNELYEMRIQLQKHKGPGGWNKLTIDQVMKMNFAGYSSITYNKKKRYTRMLEWELSSPDSNIPVADILKKMKELSAVKHTYTYNYKGKVYGF